MMILRRVGAVIGSIWIAAAVCIGFALLLTNNTAYASTIFISAPNRADMVHDPVRNMLYITNGDHIARYDMTAGSFAAPWVLGGNLKGIDISPDNSTLAVADLSRTTSEVWVHLITIEDGTSQKLLMTRAFGEGGTYAVAFGSDGNIYSSSDYEGSGWVPFRRIDPLTNTSVDLAAIRHRSMVSASANGSIIAFAEADISDGRFGSYNVVNGILERRTGYDLGTAWFNYDIASNHDATQFAIPTYGGTFIYDQGLNKIMTLGTYATEYANGVAYNPVTDDLYLSLANSSIVRAYNSKTFETIADYTVAHPFGNNGNWSFDDGRLKTSRDGNILFAAVNGGIEYVVLGAVSGDSPILRVPSEYSTIQEAINSANAGGTVLVAPGTYYENINFLGKAITVTSEAGPSRTSIDGRQAGPVIMFNSHENTTSLLSGFTIRNGLASWGAGITLQSSSPTIIGNIFDGNSQSSGGFGAAIGGNNASPVIEQNYFMKNTCDTQWLSGVVSFVNDSSPSIMNNIFHANPCTAINMTLPQGNHPRIVNNTIVGNRTGIRIDRRVDTSLQEYVNNIIAGNETGLHADFGSEAYNPAWRNNLVVNNSSDYDSIGNQTGIDGNISADPLFVNASAGNYRLAGCSPAIDAGDNTAPGLPGTDFDGNQRITNGRVDMGAFEYSPSAPTLAIDPIGSPTRSTSLVLSGTVGAGITVYITSPSATISSISYPTPTTWTATLTNLAEGNNSIIVTASENACSSAALTAAIVVDTVPPQATIDSAPASVSASNTADFSFTSSEPDSAFECRIDNNPFETCSSPKGYRGLTDGNHVFMVRATDIVGNTGTPASYAWTINAPPTGSVLINNGAATTKSRRVSLTILAQDSSGIAHICVSNTPTCSLWNKYITLLNWNLSAGSGTKTVYVWFRNKLGNASTAPSMDTIILEATPGRWGP